MNSAEALKILVATVKDIATQVSPFFWRLDGSDDNSLCQLLNIREDELVNILRLCGIYGEKSDNLSRKHLDMFVSQCTYELVDTTKYRSKDGKLVTFIKTGKGKAIKPQKMYKLDGSLSVKPLHDVHVPNLRRRSQTAALSTLSEAAEKLASEEEEAREETKVE